MKKFTIIKILMIFLAISVGCDIFIDEEKTENNNLIRSKELFLKHVVFVKVHDPINVKIKTDGNIVDSEGKTEFLLHVGMICDTKPERHSSLVYKMLGISKKNINLEYTLKFDHRSFGKNLITIDRGRFEVPFFE